VSVRAVAYGDDAVGSGDGAAKAYVRIWRPAVGADVDATGSSA
jgi:hypothetical protein